MVKRAALLVFVASVVINAAMGIAALFMGDFGDTQGKILLTSLSVSGASLIALAALPAWERRSLGYAPLAGGAASVVGFILFIVAIWTEFDIEPVWKLAVTFIVVAVTVGYASLLSLFRLPSRFNFALPAAYGLASALALLVVAAMWAELEGDAFGRTAGVLAILLAAATVTVPVVYRAGRGELAAARAVHAPSLRHCPNCGARATGDDGQASCASCGARFRVQFEIVDGQPKSEPETTEGSRRV